MRDKCIKKIKYGINIMYTINAASKISFVQSWKYRT